MIFHMISVRTYIWVGAAKGGILERKREIDMACAHACFYEHVTGKSILYMNTCILYKQHPIIKTPQHVSCRRELQAAQLQGNQMV